MAVITTGSTLLGLIPGLNQSLAGTSAIGGGSVYALPELAFVTGNPDGVVTAITGSQVLYDVKNIELYMALWISGTGNYSQFGGGGSTWIHLGSVS